MKKLLALLASLLLAMPALAKDEFHLYNWNNYLAPETVKRFEELCKCTVVQTYYSDNEELLAKLSAGAKGYDMYVPTTNAVQALIRSGRLKPVDKARLPNLKNIDPVYLNAPFDPILESQTDGDLLLYIVDLYARDGKRPNTLEAASERKNDLLFGNQTYIRLNYCLELSRLRRKLNGGDDEPHEKVVLLSYRPGLEEPGPEKSFEMSAGALAQRWRAGVLDMEYSEKARPNGEVVFVRRA